ncbi:YegP family protein [Lysobacter soli]|uniref:YegP family protein n=1 Tax=Lysobacter soli TaxID=453783 RepID=UPI0037C77897
MGNVPAHFQLYKDARGDWRWRLRAANNGKIIADSAEGYGNRADCIHGIRLVAQVAPTPFIWDLAKQEYVTS